jgi:hypothetical protein
MRMVDDDVACGLTGSPVQRLSHAGPNLVTSDFIDRERVRKRDYTTEIRTSRATVSWSPPGCFSAVSFIHPAASCERLC